MIARLRSYRDLFEAREEWDRLGVRTPIGDPVELWAKAFVYVEGADPGDLESISLHVQELGGRCFRCDTSVTRMLIVCPREAISGWIHMGSDPDALSLIGKAVGDRLSGGRTIHLPGRTIPPDRTAIMGVLNVTPDSFFDGGRFLGHDDAVARAMAVVEEGADIIDIGGESTRPYSEPVPIGEEKERILPVIREIAPSVDVPVSVDTRRAEVARSAVEAGASMINDVSGLRDPEMIDVVAELDVPVVMMHMRGEPRTMQRDIAYDDVVGDIMLFLSRRMNEAVDAGVREEKMIIDPGIGFGKTVRDNLDIIDRLREFRSLGRPVMVGPSRKSFIGGVLDLPSGERLEGTLAAVTASVMNGADIVRVHDVREAVRVCRMADALIHRRDHETPRISHGGNVAHDHEG